MRKLLVAAVIAALSLAGSAAISPAPAQATTCQSDPEAVCVVLLTGMGVACKYTGKYLACFQ
jgi:hypothetical protein